MAAEGWMCVRNIPDTKNKSIKEVLDDFKKDYDLCPKCKGVGHKVKKYDAVYGGVSTVRISDSEALKQMQKEGTLNTTVFERIIETLVHKRKQCGTCKGFGFVNKFKEEDKAS